MAGFSLIAYTPAVQDAQRHYAGLPQEVISEPVQFGDAERSFIEDRDGFYLATVNSDGWPYVQFRGGPRGLLRVLDGTTIGWADFRGNRQYVSVGNLADSDRISLILMDYGRRRRLKLFARASVVDAENDPDLAERLTIPGYRGRVERCVTAKVVAFDWNCPQHITPRWSKEEWALRGGR